MESNQKQDIFRILTSFAEDYITKIPIDPNICVDHIVNSWKERRRFGFNLTLQIILAAYTDLLETSSSPRPSQDQISLLFSSKKEILSKDVTNDESYVPETMELIEEPAKHRMESTCLLVPETQMFSKESKLNGMKKKSPTTTKPKDVSDKYSPLTCLTREYKDEMTISKGALGTGPIPTLAPNSPEDSETESPSILNPRGLVRKEKSNLSEFKIEDDDDDDFKDLKTFKNDGFSTPPKLPLSKKSKLSKNKLENRFGISITETTDSQKKRNSRLKQQNIFKYTVANPDQEQVVKTTPRTDNELEIAKALSLETKRLDDEKRRNRELRSPLKKLLLEDSMENLLGHKDQPDFKYIGSPVRKKSERKLLPAFECLDCRNFYSGANLDENQLAELLQKCSKHRSRNPPPPSSPKVCWELDIHEGDPNSSQNKTQVGQPLRTRKRRERPIQDL